MQDQPRAPHGGQPVEQPRATADTTCGSFIQARPRFPTPRCTTVPSLTTYPSRKWGRSEQGLPSFPGRKPASSSSYRFRGERLVKPSLYPAAKGRPARAPWWSASGDLTARTADARPAQGTHGGQPVEQPRARANTKYGSLIGRPTQSFQHPGAQLCSARPHIQVEPGAAVSRVLLVPRKKTCE